jgi:polysaccharide biosynthesis transport protein
MTSIKAASPPGLSPADILIVAFKHKWKVLICTLAGFGAAAAFYFTNPPLYQSDAKLLVRYVVERSAIDSVGGAAGDASNKPSDSILNSEVEILTSWDLCEQVAEEIGINRLYPAVKDATTVDGASAISAGLTVATVPGTNVILISYKNASPDLAPLVLEDLLEAYFIKHLDIHRSKAAFDLVSQQTDIVRGELSKTEEDLKNKKAAANIISVQDTATNLNVQLADTENQVNAATTALAEQRALVQEIEKSTGAVDEDQPPPKADKTKGSSAATPKQGDAQGAGGTVTSGSNTASPDQVEEYSQCVAEILALRRKGLDLRATYSPESVPVKLNEEQIEGLDQERREMEKKYPDLAQQAPAGAATPDHGYDLIAERARLVSLEAGMETLKSRLQNIQEQARNFAKVAPEIEELERTEQLQQADYATSQSKLQNATVDEALDPSKIPNISTVQKPSPPMKVAGKRQKTVLGLAGGGFALGLGLAMFIELVLDQTVKRPLELGQRLGIPLLLSIPYVVGGDRRRLPAPAGKKEGDGDEKAIVVKNGNATIAPWEAAHFVRPYAEAIRDRLGFYFELNNMTHRPKLIAVTGSAVGSGSSMLAAGIASSLSETGEGKVLLVDMNLGGHAEVHPFFRGRPACSLTAALSEKEQLTSAEGNLFLATTASNGYGGAHFGLKRFRELLPNLKESDFDFVVFDMPPLSETSPTSAMAAYMDKVIFVVEAEKGQREVVKRDYAELSARKPDVAVVMNKVRSYAPKWIEGGI